MSARDLLQKSSRHRTDPHRHRATVHCDAAGGDSAEHIDLLEQTPSAPTQAPQALVGLDLAALRDLFASWDEPSYRADQVYDWLYRRAAADFSEMSNLPRTLRERLADAFIQPGELLRPAARQASQDGTIKYLFRLHDGTSVESVLIPEGERRTACISSQVGCAMGCTFCATAIGGLERNLSVGEIVGQVLAINRDLSEHGDKPISNVVYMGMGEPLANYKRVVESVRLLNDGVGIGQRHITISTSGLAPMMRRLAHEGLQTTLALSLHQVTDEDRRRTMPITDRYPIAELMDACREYAQTTGRRVSFEYALMSGENDTQEHAERLSRLARPLKAHINLIPLNPVREAPHVRPTREAITRFRDWLHAAGVQATIRRSRGVDIDAACGQLRRRIEGDED